MEFKDYWWEQKADRLHETLFGIVRFLEQNQMQRKEANLRNLRLYGNLNVNGLSAATYSQAPNLTNNTDRVTLNIVQSMCDTVTNKIAKNRVKPTFLTSGGDRSLKKKAKQLEKFVTGQFDAVDMYGKGPQAFRDGTIFDVGAMHFYRRGAKIQAERVFGQELLVDDNEAMYGDPKSLYRVKSISKAVVARFFPKFKNEILMARQAESHMPSHANLSNNILVVEAWHLPTKEDQSDGRHVLCIEGATLVDEGYKRDTFPFEFSFWTKRLLGMWGQPLAEQLIGLQVEINKILRTIQTAFHLVGIPKVYLEHGSKIVKAHINNEVGGLVWYSGTKPQIEAPSVIAPEVFAHLDRLVTRAYEQSGVSQLSAQSKKPEGLDSGKALREFNDIESERFMLVGKSWEQFHIGAAKQLILLGKEVHEEFGDYSVKVKGRKFMEEIKWSEIDLEEDEYLMQVFPTSALSNTPSGRLQDIQELIQAGFIDKADGMKLLDFPDLESYMSRANAHIEDIDNAIEKMLDEGKYQTPEPYQDLQYGIRAMQSEYLRAKDDGVPEERLELLRRWMNEANQALNPPAPPQPAAPQGMPQGQPLAAPVAPPTSQLLPNAPGGVMPPQAGM